MSVIAIYELSSVDDVRLLEVSEQESLMGGGLFSDTKVTNRNDNRFYDYSIVWRNVEINEPTTIGTGGTPVINHYHYGEPTA